MQEERNVVFKDILETTRKEIEDQHKIFSKYNDRVFRMMLMFTAILVVFVATLDYGKICDNKEFELLNIICIGIAGIGLSLFVGAVLNSFICISKFSIDTVDTKLLLNACQDKNFDTMKEYYEFLLVYGYFSTLEDFRRVNIRKEYYYRGVLKFGIASICFLFLAYMMLRIINR